MKRISNKQVNSQNITRSTLKKSLYKSVLEMHLKNRMHRTFVILIIITLAQSITTETGFDNVFNYSGSNVKCEIVISSAVLLKLRDMEHKDPYL